MKSVVFLIFLPSNSLFIVMIFLYWTLLFLLSIYGIHRLHILYLVATTKAVDEKKSNKRPNVVVQIPIFNERFVARRIVQSCVSLDWPKENLWIQVLDDSTDETTSIISTLVIFPLSIYLFRRASQDKEIFNIEFFSSKIVSFFKLKK